MTRTIDLSHIYTKRYENKWVALTTNYQKILASSSDFTKLFKKFGEKNVTYMRVPNLDRQHVFRGA